MANIQSLLSDGLYVTEGIVAIASVYMLIKGKLGRLRYFSLYLIAIFIFESIGRYYVDWQLISKQGFYNYIVIPIQFLFFYWLYAGDSLKNRRLHYVMSALYLLSFIASELFFTNLKIVYSFNYTFGCVLLMILVALEYNKQINSNEILRFYKNSMFYINLGVTIFYIGTLPFITFYVDLRVFKELWSVYYIYFMVSGIIMYLLFLLAIIWGRRNSSLQ